MAIATLAGVSLYDVRDLAEEFEGEETEHDLVCGETVIQYAEKAKKRLEIAFRAYESDMNSLKNKVAQKVTYTDIFGRTYDVYFLRLSIKNLPPIAELVDGVATLSIIE